MKPLAKKNKVRKPRRKHKKIVMPELAKKQQQLTVKVLPTNSNGSSHWDQLSKIIGYTKKKSTMKSNSQMDLKYDSFKDRPAGSESKQSHVHQNIKSIANDHSMNSPINSNFHHQTAPNFKRTINPKTIHDGNSVLFNNSRSEIGHPTNKRDIHHRKDEKQQSAATPKSKSSKSFNGKPQFAQPGHMYSNNRYNNPTHDQEKGNQHKSTSVSKVSQPCDSEAVLKKHGVSRVVAMDCEMVGTGSDGADSMLARVSIVNRWGDCLYDSYVKPVMDVTDYRTPVSGIRPSDLTKGKDLYTVQKEVLEILDGKILVGHALKNDLEVLFISHPKSMIRDTSGYKPFRELFNGRTPSLKKLTETLLGVQIQSGEHSSVEDAQAAMQVYLLHKREWEKTIKSLKRRRKQFHHLQQQRQPSQQ